MNNDERNGCVFTQRNQKAQASTFFSLRIFLYYIDIHIVHEKEKCTPPLRSYIPRAVHVGAELNVYGNVS